MELELSIPDFSKVQKAAETFIESLFPNYRSNPNLVDTPSRLAKMYCTEIFRGSFEEEPPITIFPNEKEYDQLIIIPSIMFSSTCAHHFLPFVGKAVIGILNQEKSFAGLSKYHRVVDWFARRPQVQENLTQEIADFLFEKLNPKGVGVFIRSEHLCTKVRGVKQPEPEMITTALKGELRNPSVKAEFLRACYG